jgi:putative aldouronate transport system permease protein
MGYVLSVRRYFAQKFVMIVMVITMFVSGGLIPYYVLIKALRGFDTIWVMVVPGAIEVFTCIIFRTFFKQLPTELKDSAFMDGANDVIILFMIYIPISKPLLATFAIFSVVGYWNSWFDALLFLRKIEMHPIQMFLRNLLIQMMALTSGAGQMRTDVGGAEILERTRIVRAASIVVTTLPIMLVYPFFQKYFTKGIIIGSIKG